MPRKKQWKNLVFEGGGVRCIGYAGALKVLEKRGVLHSIERVAGTSSGAITAALVAVGYTAEELLELLDSVDFRQFKDSSWGVIRNVARLISGYGWYKGDSFKVWMQDCIKAKTGTEHTTFSDLANSVEFKNLYVVGTNLSIKSTEVFSYETSPNMEIVDAIRVSMSIPLFFRSVRLKNTLYVDGVVLKNYPINIFDNTEYIHCATIVTGKL